MDRCWAQDVLRCRLCENPGPPMYCDICHIHLCKVCVGEHLSDESKEHKVVPFEKRNLNPNCSKHKTKLCDLHCEQCDIPTCLECVSSGEHIGHSQVGILKILERKKEDALQRDLHELENSICPKYKEMASIIPVQKADLNKESEILAANIVKHGEDFHREIDNAVQKLKSEVDEMKSKQLEVLKKQENEIKCMVSEITQIIADLRKLLNSNDVSLVSAYKSRNAEFRKLPHKLTFHFPRLIQTQINKEQIYQQIGSLSALSVKTEEHGYTMNCPGAESSPPDRALNDEPLIIAEINTELEEYNQLFMVACQKDDELWTCSSDKEIKLNNLQGKLLNSFQTKSFEMPSDITVTKTGKLVYTDHNDGTVNIMNTGNTKIKTVIRLHGWNPLGVCCTSFGDLLVVMNSDNEKQSKVVRYNGSKEKQTIQYNDKGNPLYSSQNHTKFITENKNRDICVADSFTDSRAIVVVNEAGLFRFIYTGPPFNTIEPFEPVGITTDSQSRILTTDINNQSIHILDQNGQFLCYIEHCHLQNPFGLCVDTKDNLFVTELNTGKVKKIQYYM